MKLIGNGEWLTVDEACELLSMSKPTLRARTKTLPLLVTRQKGRLYYSKVDLIEKVLIPENTVLPQSFLIQDRLELKNLLAGNLIYDLRTIKDIDGFGAISLLCKLKFESKELQDQKIYLI
jgi:hypothetical protein